MQSHPRMENIEREQPPRVVNATDMNNDPPNLIGESIEYPTAELNTIKDFIVSTRHVIKPSHRCLTRATPAKATNVL